MTEAEPHWQQVHATKPVDGVSWWQPPEDLWLDLIDALALPAGSSLVDVGCGSSMLVDALAARPGLRVVGVDIAQAALARISQRLPEGADVTLLAADVRTLQLPHPVDLWHDRAVFHFLVDEADRQAYRSAMRANLTPGGACIVATFAADGPATCSGLPVARYEAADLVVALGLTPAEVVLTDRRIHVTPWGSEQPFTIVVARPG